MTYLDRNENLYGPAPACFEALRRLGVNELSPADQGDPAR